MAIKDWKKYHTLAWAKNNIELNIFPKIGSKQPIFVAIDKRGSHISKKFKTKQQALAYAKAYMRKH